MSALGFMIPKTIKVVVVVVNLYFLHITEDFTNSEMV